MEDKDFINREFLQNCGDSLFIIEKTNKKSKDNHYLFRCKFIKYPCEVYSTKSNILRGTVNNPQIEQVEFIDKIWPQKCGDSLKIIKKSDKKQGSQYLWECEFQKYPYRIINTKSNIIRGFLNNPLIEDEFVGKIFPQNCGDNLKILSKFEGKEYYECEFQKYPYKIIAYKNYFLKGSVINPLIEKNEFIGKIFPQKCGFDLEVLNKYIINNKSFFNVRFVGFDKIFLEQKSKILNGLVINYDVYIWKDCNCLKNYIFNNYKDKKPSLDELAKSLNISVSLIGRQINKFNLRFMIDYSYIKSQNIILDYIKDLNIKCESKIFNLDNKQRELDIYIPNKNFGIEYNGNYWHSELYLENNYHQEKSLLFKKYNIDIIHIFEYEWEINSNIIKSLIKSKLGFFIKRIYARKCIIKEIDYKTYADFCNKNHLQGECGAKIKLGLYYNEELVQIMSFGKPRFTDKYEWEIIRECSKLGYQILGGKEKLWSYFLKKLNPNSVISYCDFSKFTGDSYLKLGFKKIGLNKPGFVWYDKLKHNFYWRNPYKHKEMKEAGYLKIYDCGQLVFVWEK